MRKMCFVAVIAGMAITASAQTIRCTAPGAVVKAQHAIQRQGRTYGLIQLPTGVTQSEADRVASGCRLGSKVGILMSAQTRQEWLDVKSRFGAALGGVPNVEHAWVWARTARDGYVRWSDGTALNLRSWGAWAPGEPGRNPPDALAFHAEHPGYFNAVGSRTKLTRIMLEFR